MAYYMVYAWSAAHEDADPIDFTTKSDAIAQARADVQMKVGPGGRFSNGRQVVPAIGAIVERQGGNGALVFGIWKDNGRIQETTTASVIRHLVATKERASSGMRHGNAGGRSRYGNSTGGQTTFTPRQIWALGEVAEGRSIYSLWNEMTRSEQQELMGLIDRPAASHGSPPTLTTLGVSALDEAKRQAHVDGFVAYIVYPETTHRGLSIRVRPASKDRGLEAAKKIAKAHRGSAIYNVQRGAFEGWINHNGRYVSFVTRR